MTGDIILWLTIVGIALAITILSFTYIWTHVQRFALVKKFSGASKWKKRLISAIVIAIFIGFAFMDAVNVSIIVLNLVAIWIIVELIGKLISLIRRKERIADASTPKPYWAGIVAIVTTAIYFSIAYFMAVNVVEQDYTIHSNKIDEGESFKIVMFADSHIGTTFDGNRLAEYIHEMGELHPDILVVVGDYVDDYSNKEDMVAATRAFGEIETTYGVYYVFGNHDKGYYNDRDFSEGDLRNELEKAGVTILEDEVVEINDFLTLIGRQDKSEKERASITDLMAGLDSSKFCVVLNHQPNDQAAEHDAGADLVLSGHTHGGQLLPINFVGEWTGLNDQTRGLKMVDAISYIVTDGISDWAIPFKTGCQAEYVVIEVKN